jgi:ribosomal protein S18 acetylase RimI-like enzyme
MATLLGLKFQRYDAAGARQIRDAVALIHQEAYVERIKSGNPFYTPEAFLRRFDSYTASDGFEMVVAYLDGEPAGQTWGWPLTQQRGARWWDGLVSEPEPGFTHEDGTRTFALSELMVRQAYTGQHIAHALHDELLRGRAERRATLLVNPVNQTAFEIYQRWGWRKVAQLRPAWPDAPLFNVLILPLPVGGETRRA